MILTEPQPTPYDLRFSIAGIPVSVHPMFWLGALFSGANLGELVYILIWTAVLFVSVLIHELGHAFTMRRFGESPRVVLYAMGGLAISDRTAGYFRSNSRGRLSTEQIIISFAGPAAGFLLAAITICLVKGLNGEVSFSMPTLDHLSFWSIGGIANPHLLVLVYFLLEVNIFWGLMNLLPVYPLDGGQIARPLMVTHDPADGLRKSLWLSMIVGAAVAIFGWVRLEQPFLGVLFGMLAFSNYTSLQQMGGGRGGRW